MGLANITRVEYEHDRSCFVAAPRKGRFKPGPVWKTKERFKIERACAQRAASARLCFLDCVS